MSATTGLPLSTDIVAAFMDIMSSKVRIILGKFPASSIAKEFLYMKALLEVSYGLDVHKEKIVACILAGSLGKPTHSKICEFITLIPDMIALWDFIVSQNCHHVAMESTGIYWMPIYEILEDAFSGYYFVNCQRTPYEECFWQENRYAGFRMDIHPAPCRAPERQLYSRKKNQGVP